MSITVYDDLTVNIVSDDGLLECNLPSYNPETLIPFSSKEEAEAFAATVYLNQNYFVPRLSDEEKQALRDAAAAEQNASRAKAELAETDWADNPSVRDTNVLPHLVNAAEFDVYRIALRMIAVTDPVTVETWPERPAKIWKTE